MKITLVRFFALLLLLTLAACGKERPTATITPLPTTTSAPATATPTFNETLINATLPPSWTPTSTATKAPTRTFTPTPTQIPTLTVKEMCNIFSVISAPKEGAEYEYDANIVFAWHGITTAPMVLRINKAGSEAGLRVDIDVDGDGILPIPLTRLPDEGRYEWKVWLQDPANGEICAHSGTFIRKPPVVV